MKIEIEMEIDRLLRLIVGLNLSNAAHVSYQNNITTVSYITNTIINKP